MRICILKDWDYKTLYRTIQKHSAVFGVPTRLSSDIGIELQRGAVEKLAGTNPELVTYLNAKQRENEPDALAMLDKQAQLTIPSLADALIHAHEYASIGIEVRIECDVLIVEFVTPTGTTLVCYTNPQALMQV